MNGERISDLLFKFGTMDPMTDKELKELEHGLIFLDQFFRKSRFTPLVGYYGGELERIQRMIEARSRK